jgi:hypothetical protein
MPINIPTPAAHEVFFVPPHPYSSFTKKMLRTKYDRVSWPREDTEMKAIRDLSQRFKLQSARPMVRFKTSLLLQQHRREQCLVLNIAISRTSSAIYMERGMGGVSSERSKNIPKDYLWSGFLPDWWQLIYKFFAAHSSTIHLLTMLSSFPLK